MTVWAASDRIAESVDKRLRYLEVILGLVPRIYPRCVKSFSRRCSGQARA